MPCHKTAHSAVSRLAPDPPLFMCNWGTELSPPTLANQPRLILLLGDRLQLIFDQVVGQRTLSHRWCPGHFPHVAYPQSHQAHNPWYHNSPPHPFVWPNAGRSRDPWPPALLLRIPPGHRHFADLTKQIRQQIATRWKHQLLHCIVGLTTYTRRHRGLCGSVPSNRRATWSCDWGWRCTGSWKRPHTGRQDGAVLTNSDCTKEYPALSDVQCHLPHIRLHEICNQQHRITTIVLQDLNCIWSVMMVSGPITKRLLRGTGGIVVLRLLMCRGTIVQTPGPGGRVGVLFVGIGHNNGAATKVQFPIVYRWQMHVVMSPCKAGHDMTMIPTVWFQKRTIPLNPWRDHTNGELHE